MKKKKLWIRQANEDYAFAEYPGLKILKFDTLDRRLIWKIEIDGKLYPDDWHGYRLRKAKHIAENAWRAAPR